MLQSSINANAFALTFAFAPSHTGNPSKVKRECKPTHTTVQSVLTCNDTAMNVNRFGQSVCGLETVVLRGKSKAADNRKINANFKKGGFVGLRTVVHLMKCVQAKKNATEEIGRKLYLFVAFF